MTEQLHYENVYLAEWNARIVERIKQDGKNALILDKSAFYPTGGGQPHDSGEISGNPVIEVYKRDDGAIIHLVENDFQLEDEVVCLLDWQRRFDFMQHHTAQHILSQSLLHLFHAETIGFHLTEANATIDLDRILDDQQVTEAVSLANSVVMSNVAVESTWIHQNELTGVRVRGVAPREIVRVVRVGKFDATACGGTHVRFTGEIGLIQVLRYQRRSKSMRITFVCGERATKDYKEKNLILNELSAIATRSFLELPHAYKEQRAEIKNLKRQIRKYQNAFTQKEACELVKYASKVKGTHLITKVFSENDEINIQKLAKYLQNHFQCIALLARSGKEAQLLFSSIDVADQILSNAMKTALDQFPNSEIAYQGKHASQSKPFIATDAELQGALETARLVILTEIQS